jgi:hypothetical protein
MEIVEVRGVCSAEKTYFSENFGFSVEEAREFLGNNDRIVSDVLKWYNGYTIGLVNPVPTPLLSSKVYYSSVSMSVTSILHFLVHTGYLSYASNDGVTGYVRIPNYEVHEHWREHVVGARYSFFLSLSVPDASARSCAVLSF